MTEHSAAPPDPVMPIRWRPNNWDWFDSYRRRPAFWLIAAVLGYIAFGSVSIVTSGSPEVGLLVFAVAAVPTILLLAYRLWRFRRASVDDVIVAMADDGLHVDVGAAHHIWDWHVLGVREPPNALEVTFQGKPALRIPRRAFSGQGQLTAFADELRRHKGDAVRANA